MSFREARYLRRLLLVHVATAVLLACSCTACYSGSESSAGDASTDTCIIAPVPSDSASDTNGIALIDDDVFYCNGGMIHRVSLIGEPSEEYIFEGEYGVPCRSISSWAGSLMIMPGHNDPFYLDKLMEFPDIDDYDLGDPVYWYVNYYASRMTILFNTVYTAWHSTDEVDVFERVSNLHHRGLHVGRSSDGGLAPLSG